MKTETAYQYADNIDQVKKTLPRGKEYGIDTEHGFIFVSRSEFIDVLLRYVIERKTDDNGKELVFFVCKEGEAVLGRSGLC